jgi:hypothetical protein
MAVTSKTVVTAPAALLKGTTNESVCGTVDPYGCDVAIVAGAVDIVTPSTFHASALAL